MSAIVVVSLVAADQPRANKQVAAPPEVTAGVIVIRLPAEKFTLQFVPSKLCPRLRLTQGKAVIEGERFFVGDGKVATEVQATPKGLRFANIPGQRDVFIRDKMSWPPDAMFDLDSEYLTANELLPGDVYLIPSGTTFRYKEKQRK